MPSIIKIRLYHAFTENVAVPTRPFPRMHPCAHTEPIPISPPPISARIMVLLSVFFRLSSKLPMVQTSEPAIRPMIK